MNEGTKLAKVNGEPQELDRRLDDHAPTRPYPYGYGTNTGFDGEVNLLDYWRAVRKRLWLVVGVAALILSQSPDRPPL